MDIKPLSKILFVDDDEDAVTIAKYALNSLKGVEIHYASSGKDAIKEAVSFHPDIVFLDVMMPEMDGPTTLKTMRQIEGIKDIPVVFFTAKVQSSEIDNYLTMGVVDVITKPFDVISFSADVQKIWEKCQSFKKAM